MSWTALIAADVKGRLTKPEYTALTTVARQVDQTPETIIADAIANVTTKVRGYVAGCAKNTLGETGTIPDELKSAALALLRDYLFTTYPELKSLYGEARQKETERAIGELKDAANCKLAIVPPETAADAQAAGTAIEEVSSRTRIAKRENLSGLI